jgi:hypothetical protein
MKGGEDPPPRAAEEAEAAAEEAEAAAAAARLAKFEAAKKAYLEGLENLLEKK